MVDQTVPKLGDANLQLEKLGLTQAETAEDNIANVEDKVETTKDKDLGKPYLQQNLRYIQNRFACKFRNIK